MAAELLPERCKVKFYKYKKLVFHILTKRTVRI